MVNHAAHPAQHQSGVLPAVEPGLSKNNTPLCVTDPARALEKLGPALVTAYPNGSEKYHQHDFDKALKSIASEIFGVDRMPRDQNALQQYRRDYLGSHMPSDPSESNQIETLMFALGRLGDFQNQSSNYFGAGNKQGLLLSQLQKVNCKICVHTGSTGGLLRTLRDTQISVGERISGVAQEPTLRILGQAWGNDAYSKEQQSALDQASRRLCAQVRDLICRGGKDGQAVPPEQFKDGIIFLLGQGETGREFIYHGQGSNLSLIDDPNLRALTLKAMTESYQHSTFYALDRKDQIPEFPVDRNKIFNVIEALYVDGSSVTEMDTREQAFRLLTAPLHGISHGLCKIGAGALLDDQNELIKGLGALRRDLETVRTEFGFSGPRTGQTVHSRLIQLKEHLEGRPAISTLSVHERSQRAVFDQQVRSELAFAIREEMPETARLEILDVTCRMMNDWVNYLDKERRELNPKNKRNILNVGDVAKSNLEYSARRGGNRSW